MPVEHAWATLPIRCWNLYRFSIIVVEALAKERNKRGFRSYRVLMVVQICTLNHKSLQRTILIVLLLIMKLTLTPLSNSRQGTIMSQSSWFPMLCPLRRRSTKYKSFSYKIWRLITETWLKETITDSAVSIPGYTIIGKDRTTNNHGGVCLYVRDGCFKYHRSFI